MTIALPKLADINLFTPELPVTASVDPCPFYTPCDVISFNGQGQLCPLTYAEWGDLSNHTRMSTIQSRTPEKKAKNHVTLNWPENLHENLVPLPTYLSFHLILRSWKLSQKTLPTKMKPTKCPAREKKEARIAKKEGRRESEKYKSRPLCHF